MVEHEESRIEEPIGGSVPSRMDLDELREEVRRVKGTVFISLVFILCAFISLDILWYLNLHMTRQELDRLLMSTRQMQQALADYQSNMAPRIIEFVRDLTAYAEKDPQFKKILARYPRFSEAQDGQARTNASSN